MLLLSQILAVVGSAAFSGVMLAIGLVLGGFWRSLPPAEFLTWFQAHSHLIERTIPLVVAPSVLGLAGATFLSWSETAARPWWLGACACLAGVLLVTAVFFLPLNARFSNGGIPVADVPSALDGWLSLHWARIVLGFATAVAGTVAIARGTS